MTRPRTNDGLSYTAVDQAGHVAGTEAVIDVYNCDVAGATVQHAEQSGEAVKTGSVSDAGGYGDHRAGDQAADYAGERAFHARADHDHAGFDQAFAIVHQAVNAGDSDVVDGVHVIAHQFRGDLGLFGDRDIAGAGADHGNSSFAAQGAVAPEADRPGKGQIFGLRKLCGDQVGAFAVGAGNQNILSVSQQALGDGNHLPGCLALGEDHFRHAVAQGAVVVHLGKSQVFKRHVPHAPDSGIDIYRAGAHLLEQCAQLVLIHDARISECNKRLFSSAGIPNGHWRTSPN